MKKALVLAGGVPQAELIRNLQRRGLYVLLADYYPNPPAKSVANRFYQISTLDEEAIYNLARTEQVDCVLTCCTDQALLTVANVSERLGLPCYIDATTARNVTNKRYMKAVFAEKKIPSAKFVITKDLDCDRFEGFTYPLVVKPVDCNSSKGVVKVYSRAELPVALENALKLSRTHDAVVEEFKAGVELSCDFFVDGGTVTVLSVTESQKVKSADKFVICRSMSFPVSPRIWEKIRAIAQKIADAFGLVNCPMLMQVIYDGQDDISVIEFSARTGGAVKYRLVWNLSHVDVVDAVAELTLNGACHVTPEYQDVCLNNEFLYCEDGVLDRVEGLDDLVRDGVIDEYALFKAEGDTFTGVHSSGDRVASITILGKDREEVLRRRYDAVRRIRVISKDGRDLLKREINLTAD